jgi:citrate/tricarballylate utilization protein
VNWLGEWRLIVSETNIFDEANRQLVICNACRYCEGYCPVFQAIEVRRDFTKGDVFYLANLCHDCRACHYACMYSPPHEFAVTIPLILAKARTESYRQWSWPTFLGRSFSDRRFSIGLAIAVVSIVIALASWFIPSARWFSSSLTSGAFYKIVPYLAMVIPAIALLIYWILVWSRGTLRFWSETENGTHSPIVFKDIANATGAILSLRYLKGGGPGCSYPDQRPSMSRRIYHGLVFGGFFLDLISTTLAFAYQDLMHWLPPYSLRSAPVIFGSAGGMAIIIGTIGLIWLKVGSDTDLATADSNRMDYTFLVILFLTALTGMLTLIFRDTRALGTLLVIHLAVVASLFVTAPYGKFVHALYRSLALIKFYAELNRK